MVVGGASDQRAGCHPNRRPSLGERYSRILPGCVSPLSKGDCFRKVALSFSLSSPKGGEGGERRPFFIGFPSLQALSPLVPRGERGKNALSVFHADTIGGLRAGSVSETRIPLRNVRALRLDIDRVDRLARGHEEAVALLPAEAEVGANFRQQNHADALAFWRKNVDAVVTVAHPACG